MDSVYAPQVPFSHRSTIGVSIVLQSCQWNVWRGVSVKVGPLLNHDGSESPITGEVDAKIDRW